jgi:hypothetical protein
MRQAQTTRSSRVGQPSRAGASRPASRPASTARPAQTRPGQTRPGQTRPGGGQLAQNRPATADRPGAANRPATADRPGAANRPAAEQRPARGEGTADRQGSGQERRDERGQNTGDRQDARQERRDGRGENAGDRQDARQDRLQDRQDFRQDQWSEVDWDEFDWDEVEVWDDDDFEWGLGTWMAISVGTAVTIAAFDSMSHQAGCNLFETTVDGTTYYKCGSTWYIKTVTGGEVRYLSVAPPPGH